MPPPTPPVAGVPPKTDPSSPLHIPASQTALLLLDLHVFILEHQPNNGSAVLDKAQSLQKFARSQGIHIAHCLLDLDCISPAHLKMAKRTNGVRERLAGQPELKAEHANFKTSDSGSVETQGTDECHADKEEEVVFYRTPTSMSALASRGIDGWIAKHGIKSLIIAGISSSGAVINTAKAAADSEYVVTVVDDACGDRDPAVHKMIMEKLLVGQCHVVKVDELFEGWTGVDRKDTGVDEYLAGLVPGVKIE